MGLGSGIRKKPISHPKNAPDPGSATLVAELGADGLAV
jgi:hypothetical protein